MATKNLDTDRGTAAFPHFSPKYKCCCDTIHVKQGTLMICVVTAIIKVVELLHAVISFSEDHLQLSTFYIVHVLAEIICVVLLFVAVLKDRKRFLLPFLFIQNKKRTDDLMLMVSCALSRTRCMIVGYVDQVTRR
ncbi:unnamed protein product [Cylicostephanus goldi]|uniref:Uncharacterized protein n=1 Tax=Cylicostephanus goldi TaxID=71465 RepID=A0A3P6QEG7_CYLGO|nr:unnamed protein product [Cylicostephanus goldi]